MAKSNGKAAVKSEGTANNASAAATAAEGSMENLQAVVGETSEYGAGEVYLLPVAKCWYETDKSAVDYDPRVEREIPETFVDGIKREGVLESITVRAAVCPTNPAKTLKIINGKTRFRAALKAALVVIKGGIVAADAKKALELQVLLNAHRFADESDLQCENAARLSAQGYSVPQIAAIFNVPESTARNTLKIVERVPEVAASPHLPFAAKEELSRRDPETVAAALPVLEAIAKEAEASPEGKANAGLAPGKDGKGSRKADATTKTTKTGAKVGQVSLSATKGLCDAIEGKPAAPEKPAAKPAAAPKTPVVAAKDTRPEKAILLAKSNLCRALGRVAVGESVASEAQRAFIAGFNAALFFAAGDKAENVPLGVLTPAAKDAVREALSRLLASATVETEDKAAA